MKSVLVVANNILMGKDSYAWHIIAMTQFQVVDCPDSVLNNSTASFESGNLYSAKRRGKDHES
jgi:hypothetical protein